VADCLPAQVTALDAQGEEIDDGGSTVLGSVELRASDIGAEANAVRWVLADAPGGNPNWPAPAAGANAHFTFALVGSYRFRLEAGPEVEIPLCGPPEIVLDVAPPPGLYAELLWDCTNDPDPYDSGFGAGTDLDLHLARDAAAFFSAPGDLFYGNHSPDWGLPGVAEDDPSILFDDTDGWGPEAVHPQPGEAGAGTYQLGIHYFNDHGYGPAVARLRVWLRGELVYDGGHLLEDRELLLHVGQVDWAAGVLFPAGDTAMQPPQLPMCVDADGDGAGPGCPGGPDCASADPGLQVDCEQRACEDNDGDGFGRGPGCQGPDCDDEDPGAQLCLACEDNDGDGTGRGLSCVAPDCHDDDPERQGRCAGPCDDPDGDGWGRGVGCLGPDCDEQDPTRHAGCEDPPPACGDDGACGPNQRCDAAREECYNADGTCSDEAPCPNDLQCAPFGDPNQPLFCTGCQTHEDCRPDQQCMLIMCMPLGEGVPLP